MTASIDLQRQGISRLSPMQDQAYTTILKAQTDVVILSPTGSGKTLAYLLPLVELLDAASDAVQAVVIVPNRELALQSSQVFRKLATGLRCCACYGGRPAMDEHRLLRKILPQMVFATPGRLNDHLGKDNIVADEVRYVVIDEFDKCLEMGFQEEIRIAIGQFPNVRQRILLSATDTDVIPGFVNMKRADRLDYLAKDQLNPQIEINAVKSPEKDKLETLARLLQIFGDESSIVFVNHRESAERIGSYLKAQTFYAAVFHGGLDQKQRESTLYKFSNGSINILVSTDLASRGLDIPDVQNIIHYHMPENEEIYIHRIGRTARWEKTGKTFFVLGPSETIPTYVRSTVTERLLPESLPAIVQPKMATLYIGKGKKDKISRTDVVGFLCKKCGLKSEEIGRIDVNDYFIYVAVSRTRLKQILKMSAGERIKGIKTIFEPVE